MNIGSKNFFALCKQIVQFCSSMVHYSILVVMQFFIRRLRGEDVYCRILPKVFCAVLKRVLSTLMRFSGQKSSHKINCLYIGVFSKISLTEGGLVWIISQSFQTFIDLAERFSPFKAMTWSMRIDIKRLK